MREPAFTPGPWDYERKLDPTDIAAPWVGRLAEQRFTALSCGQDVAERMANARLIAAAPALYEALRDCHMRLQTARDIGNAADDAALAKGSAALLLAVGGEGDNSTEGVKHD